MVQDERCEHLSSGVALFRTARRAAELAVFGRHAGFVLEERGAPCPVTRLLRGE